MLAYAEFAVNVHPSSTGPIPWVGGPDNPRPAYQVSRQGPCRESSRCRRRFTSRDSRQADAAHFGPPCKLRVLGRWRLASTHCDYLQHLRR